MTAKRRKRVRQEGRERGEWERGRVGEREMRASERAWEQGREGREEEKEGGRREGKEGSERASEVKGVANLSYPPALSSASPPEACGRCGAENWRNGQKL
eukprot:89216-Hanusia_phi.AAC.1